MCERTKTILKPLFVQKNNQTIIFETAEVKGHQPSTEAITYHVLALIAAPLVPGPAGFGFSSFSALQVF